MDAMLEATEVRLRELHEDIKEIVRSLPTEALDWSPGTGMNPAAVLAVHVAGAERWLIGEIAGAEPAGRVREEEFVAYGRLVEDLCALLDRTLAHSLSVLERLTAEDMAREWTHPRSGQMHTAGWAVVQAVSHAGTHLGHLEMTRQLWESRER